jgi:hypothetical protein
MSARTWLKHFIQWLQFDEPRRLTFYIDFLEDEASEVLADPRLALLTRETDRAAERGEKKQAKRLYNQRERLEEELAGSIDEKIDRTTDQLRKIGEIAAHEEELTEALLPLVMDTLRKYHAARVSELPQHEFEQLMTEATHVFYSL